MMHLNNNIFSQEFSGDNSSHFSDYIFDDDLVIDNNFDKLENFGNIGTLEGSNINSSSDINLIFDSVHNNYIEEIIGNNNKEKLFSVKFLTKRKRGRISTNKYKRKKHTKITEDNINTKIQTHYMNFIIDFINDCIPSKNKRNLFKYFNYKEKSDTSLANIKKLKNSSINELLKNIPISVKFKKSSENINIKLVDKLSKDSFFKDLFAMKYLELFSYYYNDNKPLTEIEINNRIIKLSTKTKSFFKLIQKNKDIKERIIEVVDKFYKK